MIAFAKPSTTKTVKNLAKFANIGKIKDVIFCPKLTKVLPNLSNKSLASSTAFASSLVNCNVTALNSSLNLFNSDEPACNVLTKLTPDLPNKSNAILTLSAGSLIALKRSETSFNNSLVGFKLPSALVTLNPNASNALTPTPKPVDASDILLENLVNPFSSSSALAPV